MFAVAAALLLIGSEKDAPILTIRPEPDHVIVVPVAPKITATTAEWKWYVFTDRQWPHRATAEDMKMPDPNKPLPRGMARPWTGDAMYRRPAPLDKLVTEIGESEPVEAGSAEVMECYVKITAKPAGDGVQSVGVEDGYHVRVFKVGDPIDFAHTSGSSQGVGALIAVKNLRSLVKDFVTKQTTFNSPKRIELAQYNFPKAKGAVRVYEKYETGRETPIAVRYFDCDTTPAAPPPLTPKELEYVKKGFKIISGSGGGVPKDILFIPYKK